MQSLIFAIPNFKLFHPILHSCSADSVMAMQWSNTKQNKGKQIKPDQAQISYYIGLS